MLTMPEMIEYCKIKTVFVPVYSEAKGDEEEKIISWKELSVAYVAVLPEYVMDYTGTNLEMQSNLCLICFDKKADDKVLIKLLVGVSEFKIGKYEVNEFRRGNYANKGRNKTNRTSDSPGQRDGDTKPQ